MKTKPESHRTQTFLTLIVLIGICQMGELPSVYAQNSVYTTTLGEHNAVTPEISTEQLERILAEGTEPLLDVRFAQEYAIAHIPGSINIYEKEIDAIIKQFPDKTQRMVLYCNGPFCGKSKRVSSELVKLGYTNVRRYQLGLPVWRVLGHTVQTDIEGFRYVFGGDKTAVFVDARSQKEFAAGSVPGAVNIRVGEAEQANEPKDGRLPHKDKGTRVIVFGGSPREARTVAEEIAKKAYWNGSYFSGAVKDLKQVIEENR